jgi:acyl-homoserine lactone acylase PvdQ
LAPAGIRASQIIPGGQCDAVGTPAYSSMLGRWLTNGYHTMPFNEADITSKTEERFTP